MRCLRPFGKFLGCYLPGLALALMLGRLAAASTPALGPLVLASLGFLAFAVAVSVAAAPPRPRARAPREGSVLAILSIRRHRAGHAAGFALLGAAGGALALWIGGGALTDPTPGQAFLTIALLFVAAWLVIGEAACSQEAIRRALLREIERG